jgi:hypothetical protein
VYWLAGSQISDRVVTIAKSVTMLSRFRLKQMETDYLSAAESARLLPRVSELMANAVEARRSDGAF